MGNNSEKPGPDDGSVATREVRFALVFYGGISLAIYMNGIAQEFLRMVRGSADNPGKLTSCEAVYRDLAKALAGEGGRTRLVIDIISGSSAGGINGIVLAKALAMGCENLNSLRDAWLEDADIDKLLDDQQLRNPRSPTRSLLSSNYMFEVAYRAIEGMKGESTGPLSPMIDLYVTATDLHGRKVDVELSSMRVSERAHKEVFHFVYDGEPRGMDGEPRGRNDFENENVMLAFAARCTSSFPVAFPPMSYNDIPQKMRDNDAPKANLFGSGDNSAGRLFADGGYLDNRPFGHAINAIPFRPNALPGERKLIFIDPFPETPPGKDAENKQNPPVEKKNEEIDFIANAVLAAFTLPGYETIREDIQSLQAGNRRLERLEELQKRLEADRKFNPSAASPARKPADLDDLDLADLISGKNPERGRYPDSYPMYHHLRVYGTTDLLAEILARMMKMDPEPDLTLYFRQVVRAWRNTKYKPYLTKEDRKNGVRSENAFLSKCDIAFRLRRLNDLRAAIDEVLEGAGPASPGAKSLRDLRGTVQTELTKLRDLGFRDLREIKRLDFDSGDQVGFGADLKKLYDMVKNEFEHAKHLPTLQARYDEAFQSFRGEYQEESVPATLGRVLSVVTEKIREEFDRSSDNIRDALQGSDFLTRYDAFHWHDVQILPFLEGSGIEEYSRVGVFRISPADSMILNDPKKLAGIRVGAFGGFLSKDWRRHDILWGRLDAADGIVTSLIPGSDDAATTARKEWSEKLHNAILLEEFGGDRKNEHRIAYLRWRLHRAGIGVDIEKNGERKSIASDEMAVKLFGQEIGPDKVHPVEQADIKAAYEKYTPLGPDRTSIANWGSRSMAIFSRMLDGLNSRSGTLSFAAPPTAALLRSGSVFITRLLHFAMPGSYRRFLVERGIMLVVLAGLVIAVGSLIFPGFPGGFGIQLATIAVFLWSLLYVLGRWLRKQSSGRDTVMWLLAIVVGALLVLAAVTNWRDLVGR